MKINHTDKRGLGHEGTPQTKLHILRELTILSTLPYFSDPLKLLHADLTLNISLSRSLCHFPFLSRYF